jgi:hypothetical protein
MDLGLEERYSDTSDREVQQQKVFEGEVSWRDTAAGMIEG